MIRCGIELYLVINIYVSCDQHNTPTSSDTSSDTSFGQSCYWHVQESPKTVGWAGLVKANQIPVPISFSLNSGAGDYGRKTTISKSVLKSYRFTCLTEPANTSVHPFIRYVVRYQQNIRNPVYWLLSIEHRLIGPFSLRKSEVELVIGDVYLCPVICNSEGRY